MGYGRLCHDQVGALSPFLLFLCGAKRVDVFSKLLEKLAGSGFSLEELMLEDDFLQEAAGRNVALVALYGLCV